MGAALMPAHSGERITLRLFLKELLLLLALTGVAAVALSVLMSTPLQRNLIYSLAIGLDIFFIAWVLTLLRRDCDKSLSSFVVAVPLGSVIGIIAGSYLNGGNPLRLLEEEPQILLTTAIGALVFGTGISYYFYARNRIAEGQRRLQRESLNRARHEQRATETELRLLQAQIEPHFLFNTLSNIISLIDGDPKSAKKMLENLTRYLRASLQRTRGETTTLGEEIALLRAYLAIQALRMGDRLHYHIDLPAELQQFPLPPLLIQPLVENAIKHGLEPKIEGGVLNIRAQQKSNRLLIEVTDTGRGIQTSAGSGVGLRNVRQRLLALYGEQGTLNMEPNTPCGVKALLRLPISTEPSA